MIDYQVGDLMHIPQGADMSDLLIDGMHAGMFARFGYTKSPCMGILLDHQHGEEINHKLICSRSTYFAKIYFIDGNYPNKIAYVETKNVYKLKRRNYVSKNDASNSRYV
jgi:hypothetical protein